MYTRFRRDAATRSRTADHLFWMSRYTERRRRTLARMLDVNYQTRSLPQSDAVACVGWQADQHQRAGAVLHHARGAVNARGDRWTSWSDDNPGSIIECLRLRARTVQWCAGTLTLGDLGDAGTRPGSRCRFGQSREPDRDPEQLLQEGQVLLAPLAGVTRAPC